MSHVNKLVVTSIEDCAKFLRNSFTQRIQKQCVLVFILHFAGVQP